MPKAIALLILLFLCRQANAGVIHVYPGKGRRIQNAINTAHSGDTILIQKGLYSEIDILVNKKLAIIGLSFPIVDGGNKGQIFVITHDSVTMTGLRIQNTGRSSLVDMAAVRLQNVNYTTICNNQLYNNTFGVYIQNSNNCRIIGNAISASARDEQNSGNGIHAWKSSNLFIDNNMVSGHRDGIYFEFVTDSYILHNTSTHNIRYGLHFMFSHRDEYKGNKFIDNGAGVAVMFSKFVNMHENLFLHNWGDAAYAILLKEISDSKIMHNLFIKNTVGIYMEGTNRIDVRYNEFKENGWAMRVQASCDNNSFEMNNFISNSFDVATNGTMVLNIFKNNYWDKYDGYDLDKNKIGDVPYYPVSMYSVVTEKIPAAMILYRSFLTDVMNQVEKVMPSVVPDQLKDDSPMMKSWKLK